MLTTKSRPAGTVSHRTALSMVPCCLRCTSYRIKISV